MKIKQQKKVMRQEVQKYLKDNQVIYMQFVRTKLDVMQNPFKWLPGFLWSKIKNKIVLEFTSDTLQK